MSEHTTETVIANQRETIRRLIAERDEWKVKAERHNESKAVAEFRNLLQKRTEERDRWKRESERLSHELLTTSLRLSEMECEFSQQKGDHQ